MSRIPTVALVSDAPAELRQRLASIGRVVEVEVERLGEERSVLEQADCAVVAGPSASALSHVRRLHAVAPTLQVILVTPEEQRRQTERALLFAPGLGEVWITAPDEVDAGRVEQARDVTVQRRRYRKTRRRLEEELSAVEPQRGRRALISDAYLAALLQVLPQPVLSVDEADRVLSWNPAAEQLFGISSSEAIGRPILALLAPVDRPQLEMCLAEGARSVRRTEVTLQLRDAEHRVVEVTVAPVDTAGHRVRSVLLHDVTIDRRTQEALKRLNLQLQQRSGELEDALTARSRFYAAMSHELRTPMNAIIGYNSLLLEEIYGPLAPPQLEAVAKAQRAAEHLLELVNDVLDLAKIEAGRIELLTETVQFPEVLVDLLDTVRPQAQERGSELMLEGGEESRTIVSDPRRVRQILLNLLSNAIKFGEGRPIRVGWHELPDGGVRVEVTDRGIGIAPEDVARIFDEFVQIQDREKGGTGLGLSISRRLAEVLGGTITVRSAPGEGSTFCLRLPPDLPPHPLHPGKRG